MGSQAREIRGSGAVADRRPGENAAGGRLDLAIGHAQQDGLRSSGRVPRPNGPSTS